MHTYLRAAGYGFATGLRTMAAPVALSGRRRILARLLILSAIGEIVADKLPFVPSRLTGPPLVGRMLAGGFAGWRVTGADTNASRVAGALCGALAAATGAALGYASRRYIVKRLRVPDLPVAIAEDALAIGIVVYLSRTLE